MKNKNIFLFLILLMFVLVLSSGCTHVRTYTVEKERVDQDLTQGNAGYLSGTSKPSQCTSERRLTRKTYVAEVEVGGPVQKKKTVIKEVKRVVEEAPEVENVEPVVSQAVLEANAVLKVTTYTVERNDTLQKISQKVYGTMNKWKVIFDANKDKLKTPDRIYAGQVLNIPQE
jgi:LysM repeat protein